MVGENGEGIIVEVVYTQSLKQHPGRYTRQQIAERVAKAKGTKPVVVKVDDDGHAITIKER
jgi:hypothetical protein